MDDLKIVTNEDPDFVSLWEGFCRSNNMPAFLNLMWLEFCEKIMRKNFLKNMSFVVTKDGTAAAIVPLLMEKGTYGNQFSVSSGYLLPAPVISIEATTDFRQEVQKTVFSRISEMALAENVCLYMAIIDPLATIGEERQYNFLLEQNFTDMSLLTRIIDLSVPVESLFGSLRKSFKSLINKEAKRCKVIISDHKNADKTLFDNFPRLYILASGRNVYTESEWEILSAMIRQDLGMLVLVQLDNKVIGGSYLNHSNAKAYYSFSANDPEYESSYHIGHLAIWNAIEYYKQRDFKWLELGWQFFGPQLLEDPGEKNINISFFKRGFGGRYLPVYRGVKFFNRQTKKEYVEKNLAI